jgi:hypothetical protein
MKKYLVLIMLSVFVIAFSVQKDIPVPVTAVNYSKIEVVKAWRPPSPPYFSLKLNKIAAVNVHYSKIPCRQTSCVSSVDVYMQSGNMYILDHSNRQFAKVVRKYIGIGPGTVSNVTFSAPIEYLTIHTISGQIYQISSEDWQFDELLLVYFGKQRYQ